MKSWNKLLLAFLVLSHSLFVNAQTIGYRTDKDGILSIGTNYISEGDFGIAVELKRDKNNNTDSYRLRLMISKFRQEFIIEPFSELLFKTYDNNIISLTESTRIGVIRTDEYRYSNGNTTYFVYPDYDISKEDLDRLMAGGISKIRIGTSRGLRDFQYKEDVFGKNIKKEVNLIMSKIDFESGF